MDPPLSAREASAEELLELLEMMRRELIVREEAPTGAWVEGSATDLRAGTKPGWYYPLASGGGLGFRSDRGSESYAHVHVGPGSSALERAARLTEAMLDALPETIRSVSVGFTGLTTEEEEALLAQLGRRPGSTRIERFAMERPLDDRDGRPLSLVPDGLTLVPVADVTLDALAELDQRAFRGTTDELLIGSSVSDYRRVLSAMIAGEVGRFVDEASTTMYRAQPPALVGALLTCEKSPRRAVFLDFMVDPEHRRRGYGTYLLRWGFRALVALGYERVRLWVSASNRAARRLYDSLGFTVTYSTSIYRWDRPGPEPHAHSAA